MGIQKKLVLGAIFIGAGLAGCGSSDSSTTSSNASRATAVATLTGDATAGKSIYESTANPTCASCHQTSGTGGGPYPDLHDASKNDQTTEIATTILNGKDEMPSFSGQLSDQQIANVIAYLRSAFGQ